MVDVVLFGRGLLIVLRFLVFGLSLGITLISFQAYQKQQSRRLQYAFIGFAFISMGVATNTVTTRLGVDAAEVVVVFFQIAESIPFIIGFSMLYVSLYR